MLARLAQLFVLLAVVTGTAVSSAAPTSVPLYQRAYFLSDDGMFSYWSFDPEEQGANVRHMTSTCPSAGSWNPCYGGTSEGERMWQFSFNPHSVLESSVSWNAQRPLRFHLEMDVDMAVPFSVRLAVLSISQGIQVSAPATEVEPGVWEGAMTTASSLSPAASKQLAIRITYVDPPTGPSAPVTIDLATDGSSYIELPDPAAGWSLTDIRREGATPATHRFETDLRELTFNNADWEAFSFQGDLTQSRDFTIPLTRKAVGVMGFVESWSEPIVHDLIRKGEAGPEQMTDAPVTSLLHDGSQIAAGANSRTENAGRGTDSVAATSVNTGQLTLRVERNNFAAVGIPYDAYIVVVYGERTLRSYRAEYTPRNSIQTPQARWPGGGACSHFSERVPLSTSARAISAEIDVDSVNPLSRWTLSYGQPGLAYYACGESGVGESVTVTKTAGALVFDSGVTLANTGANNGNRDAVIDELVRIYYRPELAAA
jgi:hypothetical protein